MLLGLTALVLGDTQIVSAILALALLSGVLHVSANHEHNRFLFQTDENHFHYDQFSRTRILLNDQFSIFYKSRLVLLYIGAVVLPLLVIVLLASHTHVWAAFVLGLSMMLAAASELTGRYLFFVTGVPVELP